MSNILYATQKTKKKKTMIPTLSIRYGMPKLQTENIIETFTYMNSSRLCDSEFTSFIENSEM